MKLNEQALANASAVVTGVIYIVCAAAVSFLPDFSRTVAQSWFHGIDYSLIWTASPRGDFVLGLVTAVVGAWLVGWAFAWIYNRFVK